MVRPPPLHAGHPAMSRGFAILFGDASSEGGNSMDSMARRTGLTDTATSFIYRMHLLDEQEVQ